MKIEIDGTWENDRLLVVIDGVKIRLTARSFKYLVSLAWAKKYSGSSTGWVLKSDIEPGFYQSRYMYRLSSEIRAAYPECPKIIQNNRQGYYRLTVEPEDVTITIANLVTFPDVAISDLAKTTGVGVCG